MTEPAESTSDRRRPGPPRSRAALLALFAAAACSGSSAPGPTSSAIQGGGVDTGDPAVGLLWSTVTDCTAFLIAPDVIATAAHCANEPGAAFFTGVGSPYPGKSDTPPTDMVRHEIDQQAVFPSYMPTSTTCPNATLDIALMHLTAAITDTTPLIIAGPSDAPPALSSSCEAVGFGLYTQDLMSTAQQKRSAAGTVTTVDDLDLLVTYGTGVADSGDSGGPLICGGVVVGAVECHADGNGASHQAEYYARIGAAASWIQSTIAQWDSGSPPPGDAGEADAADTDGATADSAEPDAGDPDAADPDAGDADY